MDKIQKLLLAKAKKRYPVGTRVKTNKGEVIIGETSWRILDNKYAKYGVYAEVIDRLNTSVTGTLI